jgi:hypothetical protein
MAKAKLVRPDSKGRITLGEFAKGISSYEVTQDKNGRIILEPFVEIPAQEKWLFENKAVLAKVKRGIEDSASGRIKSKGKFSQYKDEELE